METAIPPPIPGRVLDPPPKPTPEPVARLAENGGAVGTGVGVGYRTFQRFSHAQVPLLAAGTTYYLFLAMFSIITFAYGLTAALGADQISSYLTEALDQAFPGLLGDGGVDPGTLAAIGRSTSIIGAVGLLYGGSGGALAAKRSLHQIYGAPKDTRNFLLARVISLGWLLALGPLIVVSFVSSTLLTNLSETLLEFFDIQWEGPGFLLTALAVALTLVVDFAIVYLILGHFGGIRPARRARVIGAAVGTVAIEALKVVMALLVGYTISKPQYGAFAAPIGVMFVLYLQSVSLYSVAALTAGIAEQDRPVDIATDDRSDPAPEPQPESATLAAITTAPRPAGTPVRQSGPVQPTTVSTVRDDALGTDDLTGLLDRLHRGEVSAAELREAALARARDADAQLNAVTTWIDPDDPALPPVDPDAPFAGIPSLLKDNEDLAGFPTSHGSWATPTSPRPASSPWVAQYLALGLVPLAKTTLPEFGLTASTESSRYGATRNPWDLARSVGGSSGGSAALVAAGVVPMAHANDGGGSIRIPAACCGLVGLKPSRGRLVDLPELGRLPVHITTQGVVTRTVRDTARYYAEAERLHRDPALPEIGHVDGPGWERLRVGLITEGLRGLPVEPETAAAVADCGRLLESLGHRVEPLELPVDPDFGPDFLRYWTFLSWALENGGERMLGEGFDGSRVEPFTQGLSRMFRRGALGLPVSLRRLRRLARDHESVYDRVDVLVSPVTGHPAPELGYLGAEVEFRTHLVRLLRFSSFTPLQNVTGSPAVSLPLGRTSTGFPIGVHVAAPFGRERRLLELAYELEAAAPWANGPAG